MNVNLKRLACISAVAVLAVAVATPTAAKKPQPEEPPEPAACFTIQTSEVNNGMDPWSPIWTGYYTYSGAPHPTKHWCQDNGQTLGLPVYENGEQIGETLTLTSLNCGGTAEVYIYDIVYQPVKKKDTAKTWTGRFVIIEAARDYKFLLGATGSATGGGDLWNWGRAVTLEGCLP